MKDPEVLDCPPLPSKGLRKSVNWAPQFKPPVDPKQEKKPATKRCTRFNSQGAASPKTGNESALPQEMSNGKINGNSSDLDVPIRIVSYKCTKNEQRVTPAARLKEPKKERDCQSRAEDSGRGKQGQLDKDHEVGKQARKLWVSVPLNDMESAENTRRKCRRVCRAANQSMPIKRVSDSRPLKSEVDQEVPTGNAGEVLAKLFQGKDASEIDISSLEDLQLMVTGVKGALYKVEHILQSLQEEKAEREAPDAAERLKLRHEITKLKQRNRTVVAEKVRIQRDKDIVMKDNSRMIEKTRDLLKLQDDKDKAEAAAAALSAELTKEQEKSCCQICFTVPRDAVVLPCTHFQYCHECLQKHQRRSAECPTCRSKINGVLRCNLFTS